MHATGASTDSAGLTLTERLAEFATTAQPPVEGEPGNHLRAALLDGLGVALAGTTTDVGQAMARRRSLGDSQTGGPQGILVRGGHGALILGSLMHALDYDDSLSLIPGHPSAPLLGAMVATLPECLATRSFLEAYAIGIEVSAKVGTALGADHYRQGWHATSTVGIFGTVAALGRMHGVDRRVLAHAFGIAASSAAGLQCNFGSMIKPLHAGLAARSAVLAVELALAGATASRSAIEGRGGYFSAYSGSSTDPSRLGKGLGRPWAITERGISLKRYPCCYATHRAIEAIRVLSPDGEIPPKTIAKVVCEVPIGGLQPLRRDLPTTGLAGKFSLEYVIAAYLLDHHIGLGSFTDERVQRPEVQDLMRRIWVSESTQCSPDDPTGSTESASTRGFVKVSVAVISGAGSSVVGPRDVLTAEIRAAPGSTDDPPTADNVATKFLDCVQFAGIPLERAQALLRQLVGLRDDDDIAAPLRALGDLYASLSKLMSKQ